MNPPTTMPPALRAETFALHVEPEIPVLLRVARSLTGSWADAEDLVQETLIRAFRGIESFDGAHPRAWLLTIMRRANINAHRRQRPSPSDPHGDLDRGRPAFGAMSEPASEDVVVDQVMDAEIERALAGLDPKFRTILLLVDVDQLSYQEAADALGIPVGTVMSRLSRARKRVRKHLEHTPAFGRTR